MVVGFSVGVWTARYLGPEQFGLFSYAQSFVFLFTAFATLGLDGIVIRELVKDPTRRDSLLGTSFVLKLIGSVVVMALLGTSVALMHTDKTTALIMILVASATLFQSFNVIDFYFQSRVLSKYVVFSSIISMLIVNAVKIWLIVTKADLIWFAAVIAVEAAIVSAGLIGYYLKSGMKLREWKFEPVVAKELLKDSWPLIFAIIASSINARIDQVFLGIMGTKQDVGIYSAAVRVTEVWYFIPMVLSTSFYPLVLSERTKGIKHYQQLLRKIFVIMTVIAIFIGTIITGISTEIISYLYGHEFLNASSILSISIWATIPFFIGFGYGYAFNIEGLQRWTLISTLLQPLSNIALNIWLIPHHGAYGAAIATLVSNYLAFLISMFLLTIKSQAIRNNKS